MKISKKTLARILTIVVIAVMIATICGNVLAVTNPKDITGTNTDEFDTIGKKIIGAIQAIGSLVSVGILVVLGIKYMMGSAEEKADYKKSMIPYLVGAILIFAASALAQVVYQFVTGISAA